MQQYFSILKKTELFKNIDDERLLAALMCVGAYQKSFKKNELVRDYTSRLDEIGVVVKGDCQVVRVDLDGNRTILRQLGEGASFGESLAFSGIKTSPISIVAASHCVVIFISTTKTAKDMAKVIDTHFKIVENLVRLLAQKCVNLHIKNDILTKKTVREKITAYLEYESDMALSRAVKIPFTREELADYLGVNRSAMLRELKKMHEEGLVDYAKREFIIKLESPENRFK